MGLALTSAQVHQLFPTLDPVKAERWTPDINSALQEFGVDTRARVSAWAAQVGHESSDLTTWEEGFGYTADRLIAVFGAKRFPTLDVARLYAGDRVATANHVYAYRNGNGSESSGDGWYYRGRGPIQITGRANYASAGRGLQLDLLDVPDMLLQPGPGFRSACWYWFTRACNAPADRGQFEVLTRLINGGLTGLEDRKARWSRAKTVLGV